MATDIYIFVSSDTFSEIQIQKDIDYSILLMQDFDYSFSRFGLDNQLARLNNSEEIIVSEDLFNMLSICKKYFTITNGYFNPTIINILKSEGYFKSFLDMKLNINSRVKSDRTIFSLDSMVLDSHTRLVKKPKDLQIDLGGVGKSYIVKKVSDYLVTKYKNFCVDAGGDMYLSGRDTKKDYPYWAIAIENQMVNIDLPTLLLKDISVCTSGIVKRKWKLNHQYKNHIINPFSKESVNNKILSVTVISEDIIESDILAKVLLIMGVEKAVEYSLENNIASVIITSSQELIISKKANEYVWKENLY